MVVRSDRHDRGWPGRPQLGFWADLGAAWMSSTNERTNWFRAFASRYLA
jgi:hypothetical protein